MRSATSTGRRVVKDGVVYVPLTVDRKVMASVMKTHALRGHPLRVRPGRQDRSRTWRRTSRAACSAAPRAPVHTHTQDRYVVVDEDPEARTGIRRPRCGPPNDR